MKDDNVYYPGGIHFGTTPKEPESPWVLPLAIIAMILLAFIFNVI